MQRLLKNTTFMDDDKLPFAKCSVTHEMLESGQRLNRRPLELKRMVNFESYAKEHYDSTAFKETEMKPTYVTSYRSQFKKPRQLHKLVVNCRPLEIMQPDPHFNKRPENVFCRRHVPEGKFLDDHFYDMPEHRKKIDFFRQIRNQTFTVY